MQLFNAVRKHQKTIDMRVKEAGGSERKKAKLLSSVSKKDFIDVLRKTEGDARAPAKPETDTVSSHPQRASPDPVWIYSFEPGPASSEGGKPRPRGYMWPGEPFHLARRAIFPQAK